MHGVSFWFAPFVLWFFVLIMVSNQNYSFLNIFVSICLLLRFTFSWIRPDKIANHSLHRNAVHSLGHFITNESIMYVNHIIQTFRVSLKLLRTNNTLNVIKSNSRGVVKVKLTTMHANVWSSKTRTNMIHPNTVWSFVSLTETSHVRYV